MILTETAAEHLYEKLTLVDVPNNSVIRFSVDGDAIEMIMDQQKPADTVVLYKKILLVALTPETANQLESTTVDLTSTKKGKKLVLR